MRSSSSDVGRPWQGQTRQKWTFCGVLITAVMWRFFIFFSYATFHHES